MQRFGETVRQSGSGDVDFETVEAFSEVYARVAGAALTEPVDGIVLGRTLAEGFIPHWASEPEGEDQVAIDWMNRTPKVVVSNTLTDPEWANTRVEIGGVTSANSAVDPELASSDVLSKRITGRFGQILLNTKVNSIAEHASGGVAICAATFERDGFVSGQ